jgi:hypothetical protein
MDSEHNLKALFTLSALRLVWLAATNATACSTALVSVLGPVCLSSWSACGEFVLHAALLAGCVAIVRPSILGRTVNVAGQED